MKRLSLVVVCWLGLASVGYGQVLTGHIFGVVRDGSGAVLPGVTVTLSSETALESKPLSAVTNENGEYRFMQVRAGTYNLTTELTGFSAYKEERLQVAVGGNTERNIALNLASVSESVTVSGVSPMVDTRQVGVAGNINEETLEALPVHRYQMAEFAKWSPGVAPSDPAGSGANLSIMGSGTNENSVLIDGINILTPNGGNWGSGDLDAAEEVQVVTLAASAEYQVAQGGVINVVMKQGSNRLSGDASGYWYPDGLISKPILLPCNCPEGETGFETLFWRNYSGHLGGPIWRDRLWFYVGGNWDEKIITTPGIDPDRARRDHPFYSHASFAKVTWGVNDNVKIKQVYSADWWGGQVVPTVSMPFETLSPQFGLVHSYSTELNWTLKSNSLLTVRATGIIDPDYPQKPFTDDTTSPIRRDSLTGVACCGVSSFGELNLWRHGQAAKLNQVFTTKGLEHNTGLGMQFEHAGTNSFMAFPSGVNYTDAGGRPDQATFRDPFLAGAKYSSFGLWGEDKLTFRRLTVSLGLRWDRMKAVSQDLPAVDGQLGETGQTINGLGDMFTWNVWAARVGFNLRLTADNRTVLRGTYGRAYRPVFTNDFQNLHPGASPITTARFDPATGGYTTVLSVVNPIANQRLDSGLDAPHTDSFSIGVDRELGNNMAASASYVHKEGRDLIGWVDVGGVYGTQDVTLSNGQVLTVFPILNSTGARIFQRTNGPGFFTRYNGMLLTLSKRWSHNWQANMSYTYSKAEGLTGGSGGGATSGQDPNDYIYAAGRLATDRPHVFTLTGSYEIPKVVVLVSSSFMSATGNTYAPQAQVQLPQGRLNINIAPPDGTYRLPTQNILGFRFSKILFRSGARRLELAAELMNALQSEAFDAVTSRVFNATTFGTPSNWIEPRRMNFLVRFNF